MNKDVLLAWVAALLIVGIGAFAYFDRAHIAVLHPAGPVGAGEMHVMLFTMALSGIIVIPVFFFLFVFVWFFSAEHPRSLKWHFPDWDHHSKAAEFIWWLVPSAIIAVLAVMAWQSAHALDPYKPLVSAQKPIEIQVVALDWKWLFIYPEQGIATVNMLEFPAGTPVHFDITADAPMNSFWIPSLGGQIMAMPGMSTQLNLMADAPGAYNGVSANISGEGFSGMNFVAKSVSQSDFDAWVQSVKQNGTSLNRQTYATLAATSTNNAPTGYSLEDVGLYDSIVMHFMLPADSMSMPMNEGDASATMQAAPVPPIQNRSMPAGLMPN